MLLLATAALEHLFLPLQAPAEPHFPATCNNRSCKPVIRGKMRFYLSLTVSSSAFFPLHANNQSISAAAIATDITNIVIISAEETQNHKKT